MEDQTPTQRYSGAAYASQETCWKCGTDLYRLVPPVDGAWHYWCRACQMLTLTQQEAQQALDTLQERHPGAIGAIVSWPFPLVFTPATATNGTP
jgi:hypothetical protein